MINKYCVDVQLVSKSMTIDSPQAVILYGYLDFGLVNRYIIKLMPDSQNMKQTKYCYYIYFSDNEIY